MNSSKLRFNRTLSTPFTRYSYKISTIREKKAVYMDICTETWYNLIKFPSRVTRKIAPLAQDMQSFVLRQV